MRALAIVIALTACSDDKPTHQDAAVAHDGMGDAHARDAPYSCAVTGNCAGGPSCGTACCGEGEHCVAGECRCGDAPACTNGEWCLASGVVGMCGAQCCDNPVGCSIGLR